MTKTEALSPVIQPLAFIYLLGRFSQNSLSRLEFTPIMRSAQKLVPETGLEPARLTATASKTVVSAIPPPGRGDFCCEIRDFRWSCKRRLPTVVIPHSECPKGIPSGGTILRRHVTQAVAHSRVGFEPLCAVADQIFVERDLPSLENRNHARAAKLEQSFLGPFHHGST